MSLEERFEHTHKDILKDTRPKWVKLKADARKPDRASLTLILAAVVVYVDPVVSMFSDVVFIIFFLYFFWIFFAKLYIPFKLPKSAGVKDKNNLSPNGKEQMAEGILYLGNKQEDGDEIWFNNNDARTHILYLGTTGAGKTVGLKGITCNALCWSSGYVYIDGKADTDLWADLSALARRFGRDDDLLIMNYMTGNAGGRVPSNTLNPFASGSASYITNMLVSLMPESQGDNAMWKDRAVSLISGIMPCLVHMRDNRNMPLSIGVIRKFLTLPAVIKLSRDESMPLPLRSSVKAYLDELPGYVDDLFDDEGNEKPQQGGGGGADTPRQQHGFLSMQFTRSMSSLGDDYGFIFDTQAADVDMTDVVLQRRLLVVLIPALEKSGDETANLGKIIVAALKGMMGATLGNTVEGSTATAIDNKPTNSHTPFIAIFDEVGYYASSGMAVMAAQARSLGFSLIFAGQDIPALEKRIKEETKSITANCNIKIFGKLEDPTTTKEFFEKTVGSALVTEVSGFEAGSESKNAGIQTRARANYDDLRNYREGQAICTFGKRVADIQIYYADVGHAKAMRVHRFLPLPPPSDKVLDALLNVNTILKRFRDPKWNPDAEVIPENKDIAALEDGFAKGLGKKIGLIESGAKAVVAVAKIHGLIDTSAEEKDETASPKEEALIDKSSEGSKTTTAAPEKPVAAVAIVDAPISWADLIGTDESKEDNLEVSVPKEDKEVNILKEAEDVIGEEEEVEEEGIIAGIGPVPTPTIEEDAGPMSWANIMGDVGDSKTEPEVNKNSPPVTDSIEPEVVTKEDNVVVEEISVDIPVVEPVEDKTKLESSTKNVDNTENAIPEVLNWGDVIGFNSGEENKDS